MLLKHGDKKGRVLALKLKSLLLVGGPFIFSFEENKGRFVTKFKS